MLPCPWKSGWLEAYHSRSRVLRNCRVLALTWTTEINWNRLRTSMAFSWYLHDIPDVCKLFIVGWYLTVKHGRHVQPVKICTKEWAHLRIHQQPPANCKTGNPQTQGAVFFLLFLSKLHQHRPHSFKELCRMFLWVFVFVCVPHPLPWLRAQHCYLHHPWRARVLPDGKMWSTNQPKAKLEICAQPDVQAKPRSSQKSPCIVRNLF